LDNYFGIRVAAQHVGNRFSDELSAAAAMSGNWQPQIPVEEFQGGPTKGGPDGIENSVNQEHGGARKKVVIVGLGMVGISFM